jgi:hypothetical protein
MFQRWTCSAQPPAAICFSMYTVMSVARRQRAEAHQPVLDRVERVCGAASISTAYR